MQIKKSELRKVVKEHMQMFFSDSKPFATVGRAPTFEAGIEDPNSDGVKVDEDALEDAIAETIKGLEKNASLRMRAEAKGVSNVRDEKVKKVIRKMINEISGVDSLTEATKWYDAIKRPVKVGDRVHVGHKQKGGAGIEGIVTKINKDGTIELRGTGSEKHRTFRGKLKNTAILEISGVDSLKPNDPRTPGADDVERDAADDVMEADPKAKKGRPRGGPHIENVRFWDLPESSLKHIIADASDAVKRLPMARKAGKWADEVNDAVTVLHWRKKKGITVEEGKDEKKKDKIKKRPWVDGLDPAGGIGEAKDVMTRTTNPKTKAIIAKMHKLVRDKLKLKSVERIDPVTSDDYNGIAFVFGDKSEGNKFAKYLKSQRALGKIRNLTGNRIMVSLHY